MAMRVGLIYVEGLATRVVTFGGWLGDALPTNHVILCIPGNPSITHAYQTFMATLHSKVGVPVWIVSHAGLELPPRTSETLRDNLKNYNLNGQIRHKRAFIEKYIPIDVKITLIGHSIGCKMILDLMKSSDIHKQVDKCYLLFPAIERLAASPNGKFFVEKFKPFLFLVIWASRLFNIMPFYVKNKFMRLIINLVHGSQNAHVEAYVQSVRPEIIQNALFLAFDEIDTVTDLDKNTIEKYSEKLVFYYGATDKWVPLDYCRNMKETFPNANVIECERGFKHAFVIHESVEVGLLISDMILSQIHSSS